MTIGDRITMSDGRTGEVVATRHEQGTLVEVLVRFADYKTRWVRV